MNRSTRDTGQSKQTYLKGAVASGFLLVGGVGCGEVRGSWEGVKGAMSEHPGGEGQCYLPTGQNSINILTTVGVKLVRIGRT